MTWREDYRRVTMADGRKMVGASFRGVPFFVDVGERTGGRRVVVHEFPLRADPFVEDLDRRARRFRVDGWVIGDDYLKQRDALLVALEDTAGPGTLRHPFYGDKNAICDTVTVRESRNDGGMAMFAIEFVEAPAQSAVPTVQVDAPSAVASASDVAQSSARTELLEKMKPGGLPAFALASAETALTNAATALGRFMAPVITDTQEAAALAGQVTIIQAEASSLVRAPGGAYDAFLGAMRGLTATVAAAPGAVVSALLETYAADLGPEVKPTTSTREQEFENQLALTGALRRAVAAEAARLAPLVPYATIDDALAARDQIGALLEEQAGLAGDTAYPSIVALRSEVLRSVPGGQSFASLRTVTRSVAIPSVVLAYQLYGSVDLELDVVARNRIPHPGFVAGSLRVLSRV